MGDSPETKVGLGIHEYSSLRQEIGQREQRKFQVTAGYLTVSLAICGFAWERQTPELFLIPPVVVAIGMLLLLVEDRRIRRIAHYILDSYETVTPGWETAMRDARRETSRWTAWWSWLFGRGLLPLAALGVAIFGWFHWNGPSLPLSALVLVLVTVGSILAMWKSSQAYLSRRPDRGSVKDADATES